MKMDQMKYFITVAKCHSISKAADMLYISQSSLSRQISGLEEELNCQLFIRSKHSLQLTHRGKLLYEEFDRIYCAYQSAICIATSDMAETSGRLRIGVLDGMLVGDMLGKPIQYFSELYPQYEISLVDCDYSEIIEKLHLEEIDLAYSLLFDLEVHKKFQYEVVEKTCCHIAVHKNHRLSLGKSMRLSDFRDDPFIMVTSDNSELTYKLIREACAQEGFEPKAQFVPSRKAQMLWLQANRGVCIFDTRNQLINDSYIHFLNNLHFCDPSMCMAWNRENKNPGIELFKEVFHSANVQNEDVQDYSVKVLI